MVGSSIIAAKAAVVVRLEGDNAEVVKCRGEELVASIHKTAKRTPGVRFLVLTPKDSA